MIAEIGHFALVLALCVAVVQAVVPLVGARRGNAAWMNVAGPAATLQFLFIAVAFGALTNAIPVVYTGVLPDLFREGQGVVVEGRMEKGGHFQATEVLAKHDENYMPKEVADALKKSGQWNDGKQQK